MDTRLAIRTAGRSADLGSETRRKRLNVALLISSYAAGQGAIFAVQTLLVAQEKLPLLAAFGSAFSFAMLASLLIDFGALTVLARETAHAEGIEEHIWSSYWSVTGFRLAIAVGVAALALAHAGLGADEFSLNYTLWALPSVLLWSFNASGVLDGLRLGGISGLTASLPYLCSALALSATIEASPAVAGAVLGGALTAGYVLTLVGQYTALRIASHAPQFVRPAAGQMLTLGRDAGTVLLTTLPGQLYFRYQLLLANFALGPAGAALFIYAKQIATAFAQVVGFVQRVEFPDLVARLTNIRGDSAALVLNVRSAGTLVGGVGTAVMTAGGLTGYLLLPAPLSAAALAVAMFGPVVVAGAIVTALVQHLQAGRQYAAAATAMAVAVGVGASVSAAVLALPAIVIFAVADLVLYGSAILGTRAALLAQARHAA